MTSMSRSLLRSVSTLGWSFSRPRPLYSLPVLKARSNNHIRQSSTMDGAASKMIQANRLRQVFTEGKRPAMGFWQMLPGTNISRALASAGADWVMVDCEHGVMNGMEPLLILSTYPGESGYMSGSSLSKQMQRCTKPFLRLQLWESPQLSGYQISSRGW